MDKETNTSGEVENSFSVNHCAALWLGPCPGITLSGARRTTSGDYSSVQDKEGSSQRSFCHCQTNWRQNCLTLPQMLDEWLDLTDLKALSSPGNHAILHDAPGMGETEMKPDSYNSMAPSERHPVISMDSVFLFIHDTLFTYPSNCLSAPAVSNLHFSMLGLF